MSPRNAWGEDWTCVCGAKLFRHYYAEAPWCDSCGGYSPGQARDPYAWFAHFSLAGGEDETAPVSSNLVTIKEPE